MSKFESKTHFINYLNKAIRKSGDDVDGEQLMTQGFYVKHIYNKGLADKYVVDLWDNIALLEMDNTIEWLTTSFQPATSFPTPRKYDTDLTSELIDISEAMENTPGVYSFWTKDDKILYIGKSVNLGSRILTSANNVARDYPGDIYLRICPTKTESDASILEVFLICQFKPPYNSKDKYNDAPTITIEPNIDLAGLSKYHCIKAKIRGEE